MRFARAAKPGFVSSRLAAGPVTPYQLVLVPHKLGHPADSFAPRMDLSLSAPELEFRDELRDWIAANHPGPSPQGDEAGFEHRRAWQRKLNDRGWAGLSWPERYGGAGATLVEQAIFYEEVPARGRRRWPTCSGWRWAGRPSSPTATRPRSERYLAPILSAEEIWCQGFSEPESGSDLASLKTRAVRDGDDWVVTGQKVWTTLRAPSPSGACWSRAPTPTPRTTAASPTS